MVTHEPAVYAICSTRCSSSALLLQTYIQPSLLPLSLCLDASSSFSVYTCLFAVFIVIPLQDSGRPSNVVILLAAGAESAGVSVVVGGLEEAADGGTGDMSTHAIIRCDVR